MRIDKLLGDVKRDCSERKVKDIFETRDNINVLLSELNVLGENRDVYNDSEELEGIDEAIIEVCKRDKLFAMNFLERRKDEFSDEKYKEILDRIK